MVEKNQPKKKVMDGQLDSAGRMFFTETREQKEAKERQKMIQESSQRTVSDIKQEREAESVVMSLSKELEEARKYCLRLNEEEYSK